MNAETRPSLRARLKAGATAIGSYVTIPSPEIVEVLAAAGMDYVVLDLQHSSPNWETLANMVRAADASGVTPIVRVDHRDPPFLLKVLELGAEGLSLPDVRDAAELRAVADAVYYPPLGHRGACGHTRVANYNTRRGDFPEHMRRQNERVLLWPLLESPAAIPQIGAIAAVRPGADVLAIGRGDLSTAMGYPGQIDHPEVVAATEAAIGEVRAASNGTCVTSIMIHDAGEIARWLAKGTRMFTWAADVVLLGGAARSGVDAFRSAAGSPR